PSDFGLIAMVTVVTGFVGQFGDLGMSMATVQRARLNDGQVSTLFWINVVMGAVVMLVTAACAPLVAWFYAEPRLTAVTLVLSTGFFMGGLTVQHQALLKRKMRFSVLAGIRMSSTIVGSGTAIALAWRGASYWALVVGQLASTMTQMVLVWAWCRWRPAMPARHTGVRPLVAFGGNLTASNVLNYVAGQIDKLLVGRFCGAEPLGVYSKAAQLLVMPVRQITAPVSSVAIPMLSRLQYEPERFRDFYRHGIQLLVTVEMPVVVFSFVVADKLVLLLLGPQWSEAVGIFRILAPAAFLMTFNAATLWVYTSLGQVHRRLRWAAMAATVRTVMIVAALPFGIRGIAAAYSFSVCVLKIPGIMFCFRFSSLKVRDLFNVLWRPAFASTVAGGLLFAALSATTSIAPATPLLLEVAISGILYGILYLAVWLALPRGRSILLGMRHLAKDLRRGPEGGDRSE
ncbi:MAG: lipopolysaccharide biosynthesis protein, partial [Pirellulales bacterium]